ncbi:MAG: protein kinase [Polyangiales bacterium]
MPPAPDARSRRRVLLELGQGGMGTVYLVADLGPSGFHRLKVVKRLRDDLAREPGFLQMFQDEARLSASLYHPNIVQVNEVGFDGAHHFLEMEYLDGQSLSALLRKQAQVGAPLPLPLGIWIVTQVLAGLEHAHDLCGLDGAPLSIVHRDVSPHNVLVTYAGEVKLLDFGIAKATDTASQTRTGDLKGKLAYMAPEQAARGHVDRRADLFAVGVMLWEIATGTRLWSGLGDLDILRRLERGEIPKPSSVRADLPSEIDTICARATALDPAARYATAADFQHALEALLTQRGDHPTGRALGELVTTAFAERRASMRAQIDELLRTETGRFEVQGVAPPPLAADTFAVTPAGTRSRGGGTDGGAKGARRYRWAAPSLAALVALGAIVGVARRAFRDRTPNVVAPAASASPVAAPGCASNAECVTKNGGRPYLCRATDHACVALESEDCQVHAEPDDLKNDATLWVGAMYPTSDAGAWTIHDLHALELARRDFARISNGLPRGDPAKGNRPLALITCNDQDQPKRAAKHLVEDLRVPVILGFGGSQELVELATSLFIPNDVLAISTINTSPVLASIAQPAGRPRLVYRTVNNAATSAFAFARLVSDVVEPRYVADKIVSAPERPLRVLYVEWGGVASALAFKDVVLSRLRFNGKSALENGANYRGVLLRHSADSPKALTPEQVAAVVLEMKPHVVIWGLDPTAAGDFFATVESKWREPWRPTYLLTSALPTASIASVLGSNASLRKRMLAVFVQWTMPENHRFVLHYNESWTEQVTDAINPNTSYDALYLVAFAASTLGDLHPSGSDLSRAIARLLPPGERFAVGPGPIFDVFGALRAGKNVDLVGASGSLDLDLATGDTPMTHVVTCFDVDAHGVAVDNRESGVIYDPSTDRLVGHLDCP